MKVDFHGLSTEEIIAHIRIYGEEYDPMLVQVITTMETIIEEQDAEIDRRMDDVACLSEDIEKKEKENTELDLELGKANNEIRELRSKVNDLQLKLFALQSLKK